MPRRLYVVASARALVALLVFAAGCNLLGGPDFYIADNYYATTAVGSGGATGTSSETGLTGTVTSGAEVGPSSSGSGTHECDTSSCQEHLKDPACGDVLCIAAQCATVFKDKGSPCTDLAHPYCDGQGACVACLANDDCKGQTLLPFCATAIGACVACTNDDPCMKDGLVCLDFACKTPACKNGAKDGSESDIDCGGTCAPCGSGKACGAGADCATGLCDSTTKVCICNDQGQCPSNQYCDVGKKACVNLKSESAKCGNGYECDSATCSTSWTCWPTPCCQ